MDTRVILAMHAESGEWITAEQCREPAGQAEQCWHRGRYFDTRADALEDFGRRARRLESMTRVA